MLFLVSCALLLVSSVLGSGELTILHHPNSLVFKGHDPIKESVLPELYSASLGFSTQQYSNWNGMYIEDPFNLAGAVVTVAVDGIVDVEKGHNFPLKTDNGEDEIYATLEKRVQERYPEGDSQLIRVNLNGGLEEAHRYDIFERIKHLEPKKISHKALKINVEEDKNFLQEIALLNNIINTLEKASSSESNNPDIYWFKVSSLHPLTDLYGENSTQVKEAKQLLNDAISRLNSAVNDLYKGRVLVTVVTSDASHTRYGRSILETKADEEPANDYNLSKYYSKDYPVIFNIILWFGVAMTFSLLAICMAIAQMDPGRDSIIYRMTSTRLKKDN